ncbi:carbohydrate ABC transporter permease [Paenibacillus xerothermodurans]|uniref:Carbohydrate ABC transporter permease n=1 Tax=Paenibacillus xerothermodurans TaxID=1977292 RepID=A0A2W1NCC7_PAEXE|nr:carbohydrate ABC transporter permease [Paenibacillus xerothermodurans]PZE21614.1 carbohydrate ABC transporter permease [Paenibacillus xerothermodurans]
MRLIKWCVIVGFTAIMVVPFLWLATASFKTNRDLFSNPFGLPAKWVTTNYEAVLSAHPFALYLYNSTFVAVVSTILALVAAALASYIFNYMFKWKSGWFIFLTLGVLIPTNAFMVPYYYIVNWLGLYDQLFGVALVYAGVSLPLSVFIIKNYMDSIPYEITEAAFIDGAGIHANFWQIILPVSYPGIVTASIFLMITAWNELLFANLLTQSEGTRTLQVAIRFFLTTFQANYPQAFAAMIIAIVPTVVVYVCLSEKIIGGLTAGAVK